MTQRILIIARDKEEHACVMRSSLLTLGEQI